MPMHRTLSKFTVVQISILPNKIVPENWLIFSCVLFHAGTCHPTIFFSPTENFVSFRFETSKRLISHDIHSNIYNYKYTTMVEIVPICKVTNPRNQTEEMKLVRLQDDIVCLSKKQSKQLGNIGPLCICSRVTQNIYLIDPRTLKGKMHKNNSR